MQTMYSPANGVCMRAASPPCVSFCVSSFSRWFPGPSVSGPCHVPHCSWPGNDYRNIQGTFRSWSQHCGRKRHPFGKFLEVKYIRCHRVRCWAFITSVEDLAFSWYRKKLRIDMHVYSGQLSSFSQC